MPTISTLSFPIFFVGNPGICHSGSVLKSEHRGLWLIQSCDRHLEDVYIQKNGKAVLLVPHEKAWEVFTEGLCGFSDDFMKEGRDQGENQEREGL